MLQSAGDRLPWYAWPLVPFVFVLIAIPILLLLFFLAVITTPYFWLFPDRHAHLSDFQATQYQRARLADRRAKYKKLGLWGRLRRAVKLTRRRMKARRMRESI